MCCHRSAESFDHHQEPNFLERIIGKSDLMGIAYLYQAIAVSRTVARIWVNVADGSPAGYGTGFMVSPRLMLTNHHVLGDKNDAASSIAEFDFEISLGGSPRPTHTFRFQPDVFHLADEHFDYALVALEEQNVQGSKLSDYGWNQLLPDQGKANRSFMGEYHPASEWRNEDACAP